MFNEHTVIDKYIDQYRIVSEINKGSFCSVYQAEYTVQTEHSAYTPKASHVTIKVFHIPSLSPALREQFLRDVQTLKKMHHPNIQRVLDAGFYEDLPYVVIASTTGSTLREFMKQQPPHSVQKTVALLIHIGQALSYAHQMNIIHGNLTPEHILLNQQDGFVLTGFHIPTLQALSTNMGAVPFELLPYMAPEQFKGKLYKASDQYVLGCLAYECLTGRVPFSAASVAEYEHKHTTMKPTAPTQYNLLLSIPIEEVLLRTLEKDSTLRFPSLKDFVTSLDKHVPGQAHQAQMTHITKLPKISVAVTAIQRSPYPNPDNNVHTPKIISTIKEKSELSLLPITPPLLPTPGLQKKDPLIAKNTSISPVHTGLPAQALVQASPSGMAQQRVRTTLLGTRPFVTFAHQSNNPVNKNIWIVFLGMGLIISIVILSFLFSILPSTFKPSPSQNTHIATPLITVTTRAGITPTAQIKPTTVTTLPAKLDPAITPSPLPSPTVVPTPSSLFTVSPSSFRLNSNCYKHIPRYVCLATLQLPQNIQTSLKWTASGTGAYIFFNPAKGILFPGQAQIVMIYLFNTCPNAGTLTFSSKNGAETIPWSC